MKKATLLYLISLLIIVLPLFTACEKVIELDLDTQEKELVIDAHIDWEKGTTGQEQTIQLSYTQPYYSQEAPEGASGATVLVADNQGNIFPFVEHIAGTYKNLSFTPTLGRRYALIVQHQGKEYVASDILKEVPQLTEDNITQSNDGGFTRDQIMLTLRFDANPNERNNFVLRIKASSDGVTRIYGFNDRYFPDGRFSSKILSRSNKEEEKFKPGDTVEITLFRVSETYMNYIRVLSNNASNNAGLFSIPNRVRGNIVNRANPQENPLGAFRVAQYAKIIYVIK